MYVLSKKPDPSILRERKYFLYWRQRAVRRREYDKSQLKSPKSTVLLCKVKVFSALSRFFLSIFSQEKHEEAGQDELEGGQGIGKLLYAQQTSVMSIILINNLVLSLIKHLSSGAMMIRYVLIIHEVLDPRILERLYFNHVKLFLYICAMQSSLMA